MKSETRGTDISVEAAVIPGGGVRLVLNGTEYVLDLENFPWFRGATEASISNVRIERPNHLHWPDLDVDLTLRMIEHPELYPLVSRG